MTTIYRAGSYIGIYAPGAVTGPIQWVGNKANLAQRDQLYNGTYQITEQVIYNGLPAKRRVQLYKLESHAVFGPIRETWSDPVTGVYLFDWIPPGLYRTIADDYLELKNSVIADRLTAEPMP